MSSAPRTRPDARRQLRGAALSDTKKTLSVRHAAVLVLHSLMTDSGSLTTLLPRFESHVAVKERALLRELCFGVARWSPQLSGLVEQLLQKPLRRKDHDVLVLLQLGLYQLDSMRIAEHAVLNTTVAVATELGKPWARGLVNAVLRNYLRNRQRLHDSLPISAALALPEWILERLQNDWPESWNPHAKACSERPPMTLRVSQRHGTVPEYLQRLDDAGLPAVPSQICSSAIVLERPVAVARLPGFFAGHVSVQDASAQWAAPLLHPLAGERILDACAAPGGKSAHLLECAPDAFLVALDSQQVRLARVAENLQRLSLSERAELHCTDAAEIDSWWDGVEFDAVLLDAPCTGTGVIRRHPDIKLLRREADVGALVELQSRLLTSLWQVVRPGGRLLYATCSVLKDENERQIAAFQASHSDAEVVCVEVIPEAIDTGYGQQLLCGPHDGDGFFYALLSKQC